jgi:predicted Zn finger-like uncharacterized protein
MSLATRCTACGTVFRVVQDQLRVSNGWVRCGRCSEVFNAVESLVDLELDRPGDGGPPSAHGARVMEELARVAGSAEAPPPPSTDEPDRPPAPEPEAPPPSDLDLDLRADPGPPAIAADLRGDWRAESDDAPLPAPGFVRQADRAARWRRPWVRAGLVLVALLATGGLGWQVHLSHHDWIAARWPALAPAVQQLCTVAGCIVEPPRRIDSLAVESSGLVRAGAAGTYRLSVVLRNRDRLALRVPAVDLTLTDAQGRVVARRVLLPGELGASVTSVSSGADLALAATLRTRDAPVVGYTIEIFYP